MDNFDKIFKQKIEQIPFDYDPNDWNGILEKQKQKPSTGFSFFTKTLFFAFLILGISTLSYFQFYPNSESKNIDNKQIAVENKQHLPIGNVEKSKNTANPIQSNEQAPEKKAIFTENQKITPTEVNQTMQSEKMNPNLISKNANQKIANQEFTNAETNQNSELQLVLNSSLDENKTMMNEDLSQNNISGGDLRNKQMGTIESKFPPSTISKSEKGDSMSELSVNGVVPKNESAYQPSAFIPESPPVVIGEARRKSGYSFAVLKKSLENYLSTSQIGLERTRDIAIHLNNHFVSDPSLSGFEGRYTLSTLFNVSALTENLEKPQNAPYEFMVANSFPIKSKKMGVGLAFQQRHGINYNQLLFNISLAKQFVLNRNNSLIIGGGINTTTIDKLNTVGLDYPWAQNPNLTNNENQLISLNVGLRFIHKSLYASISATNIYKYSITKDNHKSIQPFTLQLITGGKLHLNEKWSLNPSLNFQFRSYRSQSYIIPYLSLSKHNKIYFGIHSENFHSIGTHFGFQAARKLDCFIRTGYSLNQELRTMYGPIHYSEIGIKLGIGEFKK